MKHTSNLLTVLGIIVIICGFGTLFWYVSWDGPVIEYGTSTQTIDFPSGIENPSISFDAIGESASFEVLIEDLENNRLVEIRNIISGPKQLIRDYEIKVDDWVITEDSSDSYSIDYVRKQETNIYRYRHEIQIIVDYQAIISLDFETNAGNIQLSSEENNIDLAIEKFVTLAGDIEVDILGINSSLETDTFETLDGNVRIFLNDNTTVKGDLALSAYNGVVSLNCSEGTHLDVEGLLVQTNNGNSGIRFENIIVSTNLNFTIYLVVGSLNMSWIQDSYTNDNQFYINVNAGNVDVLLDFNPDIGTTFETEIVSGEEEIPSDSTGTGGMGNISFFINTYSGNVNVIRI